MELAYTQKSNAHPVFQVIIVLQKGWMNQQVFVIQDTFVNVGVKLKSQVGCVSTIQS